MTTEYQSMALVVYKYLSIDTLCDSIMYIIYPPYYITYTPSKNI